MKRTALSGFLILIAGGILFFYQNATLVDFTAETKKNPKMSMIERAIQSANKEQSKQQKNMGLDDRRIHEKYVKRKKSDQVIGDLKFEDIKKSSPKKNKKRRAPSSISASPQSAPVKPTIATPVQK